MTLDSILKNLDPVISNTLDRALSNKEISVDHATNGKLNKYLRMVKHHY
jgi:hypothetical protein